jgi:rubrerythrin
MKSQDIGAKEMLAMCLRKKKFYTERSAKKCAKKFKQRVYWCPVCGGYHCTKKPKDETTE